MNYYSYSQLCPKCHEVIRTTWDYRWPSDEDYFAGQDQFKEVFEEHYDTCDGPQPRDLRHQDDTGEYPF